MEDDKLDFGDLDDFDTQQEGFTGNLEDLEALEKELGIDNFGSIGTPQSTSKTEPPSSSVSESKKSPILESTTASLPSSSSQPSTTPSDNTAKNKDNASHALSDSTAGSSTSSSNNRPFVNRNKHQYQKRYNPYQQYPTMPFQGLNFFPMPGGMHYGQGFMNMAMNGSMMGMPMMGYNNNNSSNHNMSTGSPQGRRIHVNPKFAGARPPLPQTQSQRMDGINDQQQQGRTMQQRSSSAAAPIHQNQEQATGEKQYYHGRQDDRKRQREDDGVGQDRHQTSTNTSSSISPQHMDQPFQRRRLDTVSSSSSSSSRNSPLSSSRNNTIGSGISIRGAAALAATTGTTSTTNGNYNSRDQYSRNQQPHSPMRENINTTSITSRLNLNSNNKQHNVLPTDDKGYSILQRLGGRNNNNNNNNDTNKNKNNEPKSDQGRNQNVMMTSNTINKGSLIPQYANGKSSKLIISNVSPAVTESDLKALEPKDVKDVSFNRQGNQATLLFMAIDPAVNFRRKFNRTMVGGQHISVTFAKP